MARARTFAALVASTLLATACSGDSGMPGDAGPLDGGSDGGGIVGGVTPLGGPFVDVKAVVRADDGALYLAGFAEGRQEITAEARRDRDFGLLRVTPDGALDTSFGEDGLARVDFGGPIDVFPSGADDGAYDLALVPDGIVVVGLVGAFRAPHTGMARLDLDGNLDASFGDGGLATRDWGRDSFGTDVTVAGDGSLFVGATYDNGGERTQDVAMLRFASDGTLDAGYGRGDDAPGVVLHRGREDEAIDVHAIDGARWVLGGPFFRVTRILPSGDQDPDFGDAGWFELDDGVESFGYAMAATPGGGALIVGVREAPEGNRGIFRFVRLDASGRLDAAFGVVDVDPEIDMGLLPASIGAARGLVLDDAGGFLVYADATFTPGLFRFDASGAPDPSWGEDGTVLLEGAGVLPLAFSQTGRPTAHHMVRVNDRVVVADSLIPTEGDPFVWVDEYAL